MFLAKKKSPKREDRNSGFLQNPKILDVNLVKDEVLISFDWRRNLLILTGVLCIAALFVAEVYFGLDSWEKDEAGQTAELESQIAAVNADAAKLKSQIGPTLAYKEKSAIFSELLEDHVYWTNFFSWLERNTLSSVKFKGFSGGLNGEYNFSATAKTYADVSWQVKAFLKDPATVKAEVTSAKMNLSGEDKSSGVEFDLALKINPEIFKK